MQKSRKELKKFIKEFANQYHEEIIKEFGSWHEALRVTGIGRIYELNYTDEEIIKSLRDIYKKTGKITIAIYNKEKGDNSPSFQRIHKRFGSWNKALEKAGLPTIPRGGKAKITEEEAIDSLRSFAKDKRDNLFSVSYKDWAVQNGKVSLGTVYRLFGTWENALSKADLQTTVPEDMKRCSKCRKILPANTGFFYGSKNNKLFSWCIDCSRKSSNERRVAKKRG